MKSTATSDPQSLRAEASPLHGGQTIEEAFIALTQSCVRQWQGNVAGAAGSRNVGKTHERGAERVASAERRHPFAG